MEEGCGWGRDGNRQSRVGGEWFESKKLNERIAFFSLCLFMSNVMLDMHSLYCDNLLCSEEKTVKTQILLLDATPSGRIIILYIIFCEIYELVEIYELNWKMHCYLFFCY